jgi:hypothetical protein
MLLNISKAGFADLHQRSATHQSLDSHMPIVRTMIHEAYHFAQVAASGYAFHRQCRLFMVFNTSEPIPEVPLPPDLQAEAEKARIEAGDDPELKRRYERAMALATGSRQMYPLDARAAPDDNSLMGALKPAFFKHMQDLAEHEAVRNADGLSITGVLEGSAVVHTNRLLHSPEDASPHIEAELATLPPVYSELYAFTTARAGARTLELLEPTVALALRYMQPHNAFGPLLALLQAQSPPGEALEHGRSLAAQLPEIADAGPLLGTAIDLRKMYDGYRFYDDVLDKLSTNQWGVDSYDLLARPSAIESLGRFPMVLVTSDGYGGDMEPSELAARMVVMGEVLRVQSRRRMERNFIQFQTDWGREVIGRMFGGGPPSAGP